MRSKKAFLSAISGIMNQATKSVLSLVVRRVFLVYISAEYLGLNTLFGSIVSFLSLSELGVGSAVTMCLYKPLAEKNIEKVKAYVKLLRLFNYIMMAIVLIGGICLIPVVFSTINGDYIQAVVLKSYFFYLFGTSTSYLWTYCEILLTADQKAYKVTNTYWICTVVINCIQLVTIIYWKNYYVYLWTLVLFNLVSHYIIRKIALNEYSWLNDRAKSLDIAEKNIFVQKIKDIFLYRVATYLIQSLDNIIVSVILGTIVVAYYGNYYLIVNMLIAIVGNVGSATIAGMGNVYYVDGGNKFFNSTKNLLFIQHLIFSATAVALLILADDFVRICFGDESVCSTSVIVALTILYYIQGITSPLESVRTAVGCYGDKYWQLVVSGFNVAISVVLTLKFGLCGVVVGSIVCYFVKGFILTPKVIFGEVIPKGFHLEYMKDVCYSCASFCLAIAVALCIPDMNRLPFIIEFIFKGTLVIILATIVNIIVLHRTKFYRENKEYFMNLVRIWMKNYRLHKKDL